MAIGLLGIYGVVVMHNMTPHFECETDSKITGTESSHHAHTGIHHSHHEDRHDHNDAEANSNWFEGLIGLLGDLEHHELGEGHFENFTAQSEDFQVNASIQDVVDLPAAAIFNNLVALSSIEVAVHFEGPPLLYKRLYRSSTPHRGPPTIA